MINRFAFPKDQMVFVSLGGAGEIGMNMYLYGYGGKWLMIDCGITFSNDSVLTVDVILPDPTFIEGYRGDLVGLIITHGHEDHIGAVAWLWPRLRCPVYTTPFAAALLNSKLIDAGLERKVPVYTVALCERLMLLPFTVEFVAMTHSIPESTAIAIYTPAGTVLHSGDWKLDPLPMIGKISDVATLERLGTEGVMAMICDSTNVFTVGDSGSEADVRSNLISLLANVEGCIAITCFASNVTRLESIAVAAIANGRQVALLGRSLWRIVKAAQRFGYLSSICFHTAEEVTELPRNQVLYVCTGSQGESGSALVRIASFSYPYMWLGHGDMVIFSSRIIPGNERAIYRLHNQLVRLGAKIVTERDYLVHVSGHPGQSEMTEMYRLVQPRFLIPIHGEMRHLVAHAGLARACGIASTVVENGQVITLGPGRPTLVGTVPVGRIVVDGYRTVPLDSQILRSRKQMMCNGAAMLTLVVDENGRLLHEPQLTVPGIIEIGHGSKEISHVVTAVKIAINQLSTNERRNDDLIREAARLAVRRTFKENFGKKPLTDVHLVRL